MHIVLNTEDIVISNSSQAAIAKLPLLNMAITDHGIAALSEDTVSLHIRPLVTSAGQAAAVQAYANEAAVVITHLRIGNGDPAQQHTLAIRSSTIHTSFDGNGETQTTLQLTACDSNTAYSYDITSIALLLADDTVFALHRGHNTLASKCSGSRSLLQIHVTIANSAMTDDEDAIISFAPIADIHRPPVVINTLAISDGDTSNRTQLLPLTITDARISDKTVLTLHAVSHLPADNTIHAIGALQLRLANTVPFAIYNGKALPLQRQHNTATVLMLTVTLRLPFAAQRALAMIATTGGAHHFPRYSVSHIAVGKKRWRPDAFADALAQEKMRAPVYSAFIDNNALTVSTILQSNTDYSIWEVGLYLTDGTLLALHSRQPSADDGDNTPLARKLRHIALPLTVTWRLPPYVLAALHTDEQSLLPTTTDGVVPAIEATMARAGNLPVTISDTWHPHTAPSDFLPWLAWALSVDNWDAHWPDSVKRAVIAKSAAVHRKKGTIGSIKRLLASLGMVVEMVEWFDDPSGNAAPHTFTITALANSMRGTTDAPLSPELYAMLFRMIDNTKPVRSHYSVKVNAEYQTRLAVSTHVRGTGVVRHSADSPRLPVSRWLGNGIATNSNAASVARNNGTITQLPLQRQAGTAITTHARSASICRHDGTVGQHAVRRVISAAITAPISSASVSRCAAEAQQLATRRHATTGIGVLCNGLSVVRLAMAAAPFVFSS